MQWKMKNGALAPQNIVDAVDYGCRSTDMPDGVVCAIIEIESAFKLAAKNASTKAAGLLQILPEYLTSYQKYAGANFDPYTLEAAIAGGHIIYALANVGHSKGFTGIDAIRFAIAAHRYGINSSEAKSPASSPRVLDVEARMKANGLWYDSPQPAPAAPAIIQLPMTLNPSYKQGVPLATQGSRAAGLIVHSNNGQYTPAWHWAVQLNNASATASAHFYADAFGVVQALPDSIQGWHAGGTANKTYLGIDLSEPYNDSPDSFAATIRNAKYVIETMQRKHGFAVGAVLGHYEGYTLGIASNLGDPKSDPGYVYNAKTAPWRDQTKTGEGYFTRNAYSMDALRQDVQADLANNPPPPPPPPLTPPVVYQTLSLTSPYTTGPEVKLLQTRLKANGVNPGPIDGIFGPVTLAAVKKFQAAQHLVVDGIVGPVTWKALTT